MITSRKEGILVLHTKKPYSLAKGGQYGNNATEIICREFTSETDGIAFDLEQMFRIAMTDIQSKRAKQKSDSISDNTADEELTKMHDYEENDSPSEDEVDNQALTLEMMFSMNGVIKLSELITTWSGLLNSNLIHAEGDIPMNKVIWDTINRDDKRRIVFGYISFFVKPVYRLEKLYSETEKKPLKEATAGNGMQ